MTEIKRLVNILDDQLTRNRLVKTTLEELGRKFFLATKSEVILLDIGAGMKIYENVVLEQGFKYVSHDFAQYKAKEDGVTQLGFREVNWNSADQYNLVSDIQDLPKSFAQIGLLTEVLEHVPDPVKAFKSCVGAIKKNGYLIVSCPSHSLIHQAPYYFSSGLSYYWFLEQCKLNNVIIKDSYFIGDYFDFINHHKSLYLPGQPLKRSIGIMWNSIIRPFVSNEIKSSASIGIFLVIKK